MLINQWTTWLDVYGLSTTCRLKLRLRMGTCLDFMHFVIMLNQAICYNATTTSPRWPKCIKHQALIDLWKPRWQKAGMVGTEHWNRIMGSIHAYMPWLQFLEPLQRWKTALNHLQSGLPEVLMALTWRTWNTCLTTSLPTCWISLRRSMELRSHGLLNCSMGQWSAWPNRMKLICPTTLDLVILGTVYRTWSRMNALLLLKIFGQIVPSYAHGFLPGRECAQVWLQLQGFIEVCLQQGIEFLDLALTLRNISTTWDATPWWRMQRTLASATRFWNRGGRSWMSLSDPFRYRLPWVSLNAVRKDCQRAVAVHFLWRAWCSLIGHFISTWRPCHPQFMLLHMLTTFRKPDMKWWMWSKPFSLPFASFNFGDCCWTLGKPIPGVPLHFPGPSCESRGWLCSVTHWSWAAAWHMMRRAEIGSCATGRTSSLTNGTGSSEVLVHSIRSTWSFRWLFGLQPFTALPLAPLQIPIYINQDKQQTRLFAANMQEPMPCYASLWATRWTQTQVFSTWFQLFRLFEKFVGVLLEFWIAGACGNHLLMVALPMVHFVCFWRCWTRWDGELAFLQCWKIEMGIHTTCFWLHGCS